MFSLSTSGWPAFSWPDSRDTGLQVPEQRRASRFVRSATSPDVTAAPAQPSCTRSEGTETDNSSSGGSEERKGKERKGREIKRPTVSDRDRDRKVTKHPRPPERERDKQSPSSASVFAATSHLVRGFRRRRSGRAGDTENRKQKTRHSSAMNPE